MTLGGHGIRPTAPPPDSAAHPWPNRPNPPSSTASSSGRLRHAAPAAIGRAHRHRRPASGHRACPDPARGASGGGRRSPQRATTLTRDAALSTLRKSVSQSDGARPPSDPGGSEGREVFGHLVDQEVGAKYLSWQTAIQRGKLLLRGDRLYWRIAHEGALFKVRRALRRWSLLTSTPQGPQTSLAPSSKNLRDRT